jgi:type II secretory pathway component PulF
MTHILEAHITIKGAHMLTLPLTHTKGTKPSVSIWHRDIADLFSRGTVKIPPGELAVFCRKISFLLGAGVPIKEALPILSSQAKGRLLTQAMPDLHKRVLQGDSFAGAMKAAGVFPIFMCGLVGIGEITAQLPRVCEQLAVYYEEQARTRDELTAALVYPAAVTLMMLGVIIMAVTVVLPGYAQVFDNSGVRLPALTRGLLYISAFLSAHALTLAVLLCAVAALAVILLRNKKARAFGSAVQLKLPLFRQRLNLRLVQSLTLMLGAGQPVSSAVPLCAEVVDNLRVKRDLTHIHTALAAGQPFWAALANLPYIDPLLVGLARVGEETGRLPQTMQQCQNHFTQGFKKALRRMNKLIEPIISLVLGLLLALVMLAIVLPTFEMASLI